jgi:hypothetical protein
MTRGPLSRREQLSGRKRFPVNCLCSRAAISVGGSDQRGIGDGGEEFSGSRNTMPGMLVITSGSGWWRNRSSMSASVVLMRCRGAAHLSNRRRCVHE